MIKYVPLRWPLYLWKVRRLSEGLAFMPEGDPELPDEGLPEDIQDDCEQPDDVLRMRTEDLE